MMRLRGADERWKAEGEKQAPRMTNFSVQIELPRGFKASSLLRTPVPPLSVSFNQNPLLALSLQVVEEQPTSSKVKSIRFELTDSQHLSETALEGISFKNGTKTSSRRIPGGKDHGARAVKCTTGFSTSLSFLKVFKLSQDLIASHPGGRVVFRLHDMRKFNPYRTSAEQLMDKMKESAVYCSEKIDLKRLVHLLAEPVASLSLRSTLNTSQEMISRLVLQLRKIEAGKLEYTTSLLGRFESGLGIIVGNKVEKCFHIELTTE